ncbi:MAG: UDP-N-acetylmuramoyl-tripeptide--D-alanyl-D-alanine ligase [Clostridia bacterium]|nr:UDP-N-acetylmuramoyl-tripeptide--D-alanyl-D-alanine ligase [Clostridia bacterium]
MQTLSVSDIIKATDGVLISGTVESEINSITTDSRKAEHGVLFIPLKGENADGHDFIKSALDNGSVSLTERDETYIDGTVIKVKDTRKALGDIARYYKMKYPVKSVAITGSVGKTTTKDLVYSVIAQGFKTHKTPNNFNNDIGVPLTIFGIEREHEAAVIEMGMNHFGEISYLAGIARPNCAIISNIGMSHIENLGSQEGIFRAKMEMTEQFTEKNTLFVNGDDKFLQTVSNTPYKVVRFGLSATNDIYAKDIVNNGLMGTEFTVVHPAGEFRCEVRQPGEHNIYNALAAVCAGLHFGLDETQIATGLRDCEYTASRLEIAEHKGMEIINDCYNSSPDSVRAALKVMQYTTKTRRVAILGDILEMGEYAKDAHLGLGKSAKELGIDLLVTAGENAGYIAEGAKNTGLCDVLSFATTDELKSNISKIVKSGDCILVKASHGMEFFKIADEIKAI